MTSKILVVEDEPQARKLLEYLFKSEGYQVVACEDGEEALNEVPRFQPDLVLLDLMMPRTDGIAFAERFRAWPACRTTPLLVVTAKDQPTDKYEAYDAGATAYFVKPYDPIELLFSARSLLSLTVQKAVAPSVLKAGPLELDTGRYQVRLDGREIQITKMEAAILEHLMRHPGVVFSAENLTERIHESHRSVDAIHAHIRNLRNKIEPDPKKPVHIVTLGRKGYFVAQSEAE